MGLPAIRPTLIDRAVSAVSPERGLRRLRARAAFQAITTFGGGGYEGARHDKRTLQSWNPFARSVTDDSVPDLQTLRSRSRDLARNDQFAGGILRLQTTAVVGSRLTPHPRLDPQVLGITEELADQIEERMSRLWALHAGSPSWDYAGIGTFADQCETAFRAIHESGDVLVLRRFVERPGDLLGLRVQLIEADRVRSPQDLDTDRIVAGIETEAVTGRPIAYHVATEHPVQGWWQIGRQTAVQWHRVPRYDAAGRLLALMPFQADRPDQIRGIPYLAPVIEVLKQLSRYSEAELTAAVLSAFFTVIVKPPRAELGDDGVPVRSAIDRAMGGAPIDAEPPRDERDLQLGAGAFLSLEEGEDVTFANPARPNPQFEPYVLAMLRSIGIATEIPYEVLIRHFSASFSASRAALLEAWRGFLVRRERHIRQYCNPVREWFITECVARGLLDLPGYLADPLLRAAWLGCHWSGPTMPQLDPVKEIEAVERRVAMTVSTLEDETTALTGGNWERNVRQGAKERRRLAAAGITLPQTRSAPPIASEKPDDE